MKYTILMNVKAWYDAGLINDLDSVDGVVIDGLFSWAEHGERVYLGENREEYVHLDTMALIAELPPARIATSRGMRKRIAKLKDLGIIEAVTRSGNNVYYRFTALGRSLMTSYKRVEGNAGSEVGTQVPRGRRNVRSEGRNHGSDALHKCPPTTLPTTKLRERSSIPSLATSSRARTDDPVRQAIAIAEVYDRLVMGKSKDPGRLLEAIGKLLRAEYTPDDLLKGIANYLQLLIYTARGYHLKPQPAVFERKSFPEFLAITPGQIVENNRYYLSKYDPDPLTIAEAQDLAKHARSLLARPSKSSGSKTNGEVKFEPKNALESLAGSEFGARMLVDRLIPIVSSVARQDPPAFAKDICSAFTNGNDQKAREAIFTRYGLKYDLVLGAVLANGMEINGPEKFQKLLLEAIRE